MIAYKKCLVDKSDGTYHSLWASSQTCYRGSGSRTKKFDLEYSLGKKTVPKFGEIFVFDTLEHAQEFGIVGLPERETIVFRGETDELHASPMSIPYINHMVIMLDFWNRTSDEEFFVENWGDMHHTPDGTLLCKSFTPLEVVG